MILKFNILTYVYFMFASWLMIPKVNAFTPTQKEACCLEVMQNFTNKVDSVCGRERPKREICNNIIKQMGDAAKKHWTTLDKVDKQTNKREENRK